MEYLFRQLSEKGSFTEMAKRSNVSVLTVIRYCSKLAIPKPMQLPTMLGIDESLVMQTVFPHAHIVADRYYMCHLVDWALKKQSSTRV